MNRCTLLQWKKCLSLFFEFTFLRRLWNSFSFWLTSYVLTPSMHLSWKWGWVHHVPAFLHDSHIIQQQLYNRHIDGPYGSDNIIFCIIWEIFEFVMKSLDFWFLEHIWRQWHLFWNSRCMACASTQKVRNLRKRALFSLIVLQEKLLKRSQKRFFFSMWQALLMWNCWDVDFCIDGFPKDQIRGRIVQLEWTKVTTGIIREAAWGYTTVTG